MFSRNIRRPAALLLRAAPSAVQRSAASLQRPPTTGPAGPSLLQRRHYATPAPQLKLSDMGEEEYHTYADATMERLLDSLEGVLDNIANSEYEVEYSSGVLTLKLGDKGTYVINKQPPNKQIWLSSPISGPKRYDYNPEEDDWVYSRDSQSMGTLLNEELSTSLGRDVDLGIRAVSLDA